MDEKEKSFIKKLFGLLNFVKKAKEQQKILATLRNIKELETRFILLQQLENYYYTMATTDILKLI